MEKKELPNKKPLDKKPQDAQAKPEAKSSGKLKAILNRTADIIKLIFGICLLPFVYFLTESFLMQFSGLDSLLQSYFWAGVATLLLVHLFIWEPAIIYNRGHRLLEVVFNFFQPLVKFAPYVFPIYTLIVFMVYALLSLFIQDSWFLQYALYFLGLTFALHLIFVSRTVRSKKGDILMSNYIFSFSFIYIVDICLFSFLLSLAVKDYSFAKFVVYGFSAAAEVFKAVFNQLFLFK